MWGLCVTGGEHGPNSPFQVMVSVRGERVQGGVQKGSLCVIWGGGCPQQPLPGHGECARGESARGCAKGGPVWGLCVTGGEHGPNSPFQVMVSVQRACKGDKKQGGVQKGGLCGVCV